MGYFFNEINYFKNAKIEYFKIFKMFFTFSLPAQTVC